jgi:hypothetical protein
MGTADGRGAGKVGANLHTGRVDDKPTVASQGIDKNLANQARIWAVRMALIAATIIVLAEGGMAATITVHAPDGEGRVFVDVVGTINDEDFKTFKEKTDQIYPIGAGHPKKQVIVTLVSPGGKANPAMRIADLIRRNAMSTFVPGDRTCTSACALIWLAGVSRIVGDTPQIGFHATYDPKTRRESGVGNALVGAYLRDLGLGYRAISFMTRKDPMSLEWLTPDLAKDLGITWTTLHPPRAIPIPPHPKLQPRLQPPAQVTAAWSKSARSLALQQFPTAMAPPSPKLMPVVRPVTTSPEHLSPTQWAPAPYWIPSVTPPQFPTAAPSSSPQQSSTATAPTPRAAQAAPAPQQALLAVAQRVVLYEEDPADPVGKRFVGSAVWRLETVAPAAEPAVRCDIDIPERRLAMTLMIRRNRDQALPASHTVEITFNLPADFPFGGISNMPGILMKQAERTRGAPLSGLAVKVTSGFFLLGLSSVGSEKERNIQLLKERAWLDIPVVYNNGRRAVVAVEKGAPGVRALAEVFQAWEQAKGE